MLRQKNIEEMFIDIFPPNFLKNYMRVLNISINTPNSN